jgi:anti-sigma factor RsiW
MADHETQSQNIDDELSAYLDGELDAEAVRRVEDRLQRDATYRTELQRLERAWDLLDRLPRATVNDSFAKTTIEMVALAASQDAAEVQRSWPRRLRAQRWRGLAAVTAAGLAGFMIGHWLTPDPDEQLLNDLPVLETFELYYQADSLDFLKLLEHEGLFAEGDNDHAG